MLEVGTGFHPELTGRENVYLNGSILGMTRREIRRQFDEIVAFSEVEEFLDTPVKRYSSGMYVRLAFAVAAHLKPEILLVDEVLAVGDAQFHKKCIERMKNIGEHGRTVLFVSHNMAAVLSLCRRAILINKGRIEADGNVSAVVEKYMKTVATPAGGYVELCNHRARSSGAVPLLKAVRFLNSKGQTTDTFGAGEAITIALEFDPVIPLEVPHFGIGFEDVFGQRIFCVTTNLSSTPLPPLRQNATVYCQLPELPLIPGSYSLNLSAGTVGQFLLDSLHNAATIQVVPTDFFGTGNLPPARLGAVLVRSHWSL